MADKVKLTDQERIHLRWFHALNVIATYSHGLPGPDMDIIYSTAILALHADKLSAEEWDDLVPVVREELEFYKDDPLIRNVVEDPEVSKEGE